MKYILYIIPDHSSSISNIRAAPWRRLGPLCACIGIYTRYVILYSLQVFCRNDSYFTQFVRLLYCLNRNIFFSRTVPLALHIIIEKNTIAFNLIQYLTCFSDRWHCMVTRSIYILYVLFPLEW